MPNQHPASRIEHPVSSFWSALESARGLASVPACWRGRVGEQYQPFRAAFLSQRTQPAKYYPCPRGCGCMHEIVHVAADVRRRHLSNDQNLEPPHVGCYDEPEDARPSTRNFQPATCNTTSI